MKNHKLTLAGGRNENLTIYNSETKEFIKTVSIPNEIVFFKELNKNICLVGDKKNITYLFDCNKLEVIGRLFNGFNQQKGALIVASDGRMEGDLEIAEMIYWKVGKKKFPLSSTFDQKYTPKLGVVLLNDMENETTELLEKIINNAPEVSITTPDSIYVATDNTVNIIVKAIDNGDGVKQINLFVNDKLVTNDVRGFKPDNKGIEKSFEITILPGSNIIKAVAVSNSGYQSTPDQIIVTYKGQVAESNLYLLSVGINMYKNPKYNLNYAVADATSFADAVGISSNGIFKNTFVTKIFDKDATKQQIISTFKEIKTKIKPQDVFIFYYAGHGVMNEGTAEISKDFHLVFHEVIQMYGKDEMLAEKGMSAAELREFSKELSAQKQFIVLDACQSGGATETFAMRGAAEEKAIMQLARATGVVLIASTGTVQFASEVGELGHGIFTYALLEGMKGKADGGELDKKITVKEIESYLNDRIPALSEKYHGSIQYPNSWSRGMDFPIIIVKDE